MFQKILVCLDGSKPAEEIIPYVEAQALNFGSKVMLLSVVDLSSSDFAGVTSRTMADESQMVAKQIERAVGDAQSYLDGVAQQLKAKGVAVESVVLQDKSVDTTIVKYAEENKIDLIAITSHGRGSWRHIILGSTADSILRKSAVPILVIKRKG